MCGFTAHLFSPSSSFFKRQTTRDTFVTTANAICHRGSEPIQTLFRDNFWLAHFRLSFQDFALSNQPMLLEHGGKKLWIVFNGEIYNHQSLRPLILKKIPNYTFKTQGDTETIIAGYHAFGHEILNFFEGEFSFLIVDETSLEFFAARCFYGVKPLYVFLEGVETRRFAIAKEEGYAFTTSCLQFASEAKGLMAKKTWDEDGFIRQFVGLYESIRTPYQFIIQIPARGYLSGKYNTSSEKFECNLKFYGKEELIRSPQYHIENYQDKIRNLRQAIHLSVKERLIGEQELGVYLSGGIDSRIIAYEMAELYEKMGRVPLKTFTVGFHAPGYDETDEVKKFISGKFMQPSFLQLDEKALLYSYPLAVYASENIQPYTNGAAKWWLSLFTRRSVKGVLTGEGADELFAGYPSFMDLHWAQFSDRHMQAGDKKLTQLAQKLYFNRNPSDPEKVWLKGENSSSILSDLNESLSTLGVLHPLFLQIKTLSEMLLGKEKSHSWLKEQSESISSWFHFQNKQHNKDSLLLWQNYFVRTHLPTQVLNWVGDRMEMANTLEGRTPYLSQKVYHVIHDLRTVDLLSGLTNKKILRQSYKDVLGEFSEIPKKQFNAPLFNFPVRKKEIIDKIYNYVPFLDSKLIADHLSKNFDDPRSVFDHVYFRIFRQTLSAFSILNSSFLEDRKPKRDNLFEESTFSKTSH